MSGKRTVKGLNEARYQREFYVSKANRIELTLITGYTLRGTSNMHGWPVSFPNDSSSMEWHTQHDLLSNTTEDQSPSVISLQRNAYPQPKGTGLGVVLDARCPAVSKLEPHCVNESNRKHFIQLRPPSYLRKLEEIVTNWTEAPLSCNFIQPRILQGSTSAIVTLRLFH